MVMDYIRPLFVFASKHIPEKYHKETSLYILATAGMRLLSKHEQDGILSSLRNGINSEYPFLFPEENLEIISGSQEGIYQWLAINYVLGKLDHHVQAPNLSSIKPKDVDKQDILTSRQKTVGAIVMVCFILKSVIGNLITFYNSYICTTDKKLILNFFPFKTCQGRRFNANCNGNPPIRKHRRYFGKSPFIEKKAHICTIKGHT